MSRSDSRSARCRCLSLRHPSCLALVISAAGTLRASSVPCVCFGTRHALRPRQAFHALTRYGRFRFGFRKQTPSPLAPWTIEAELLKQDAGPACGSRLSRDTLLDGRLSRWNQRSTGSPSAKQPSVLGSWLDFSIHHFRSELPEAWLPELEGLSPSLTHVFSERTRLLLLILQGLACFAWFAVIQKQMSDTVPFSMNLRQLIGSNFAQDPAGRLAHIPVLTPQCRFERRDGGTSGWPHLVKETRGNFANV